MKDFFKVMIISLKFEMFGAVLTTSFTFLSNKICFITLLPKPDWLMSTEMNTEVTFQAIVLSDLDDILSLTRVLFFL